MNGLVLLLGAIAFYAVAYFLYGTFVARIFGIDKNRATPAHTMADGVDYVPARPFVLFGHHFASIAGAGPIVGPIAAAYFGWAPVMLWLLLGCVFIGAFHDMAAMTLSVRNKGRSIASIIESYIGYTGRQLFLVFCWFALILVVATFANMVAGSFAANPGVATSSLLFIAIAPVFGYLVYRKSVPLLWASCVFVPILFFLVWLGPQIPADITRLGVPAGKVKMVWLVVLMVYAAAASIIPVWLLLQPRDYLSSYLLYAMLAFGLIGIVAYNPSIQFPAFAGFRAPDYKGREQALFPLLFITIACGACSGFHSLVASGTSSKQIDKETHIQPIGYGGMLVEGVLGVISLIAVAYLAADAEILKTTNPVNLFSGGLAAFGTKLGLPEGIGFNFVSLSVSAFLLTTLDTSTRLARFTIQELFRPKSGDGEAEPLSSGAVRKAFMDRYVATLVSVGFSFYLALGEADRIWPVFGATNQLLAALTLLVASLWLLRNKRKPFLAIVPMLVMLSVSGSGLWELARQHLFSGAAGANIVLGAISLMFLMLSVFLIILSARSICRECAGGGRVAEAS